MKNRLHSGLTGRVRRVLVVGVPAVGLAVTLVGVTPAQQASAQDIGASIAATVADAVSGIATHSGGGSIAVGGVSTESNSLDFGEDQGTAISDASGGDHNVSENASRHVAGDD